MRKNQTAHRFGVILINSKFSAYRHQAYKAWIFPRDCAALALIDKAENFSISLNSSTRQLLPKRFQSISPTGAIAGVVANAQRRVRRKIAARTGTLRINRAMRLFPYLAFERNTTRRCGIGAAHAVKVGGQRHGQIDRHARAVCRRQIGAMEIDTKSGATCAARQTSGFRHRDSPHGTISFLTWRFVRQPANSCRTARMQLQ